MASTESNNARATLVLAEAAETVATLLGRAQVSSVKRPDTALGRNAAKLNCH